MTVKELREMLYKPDDEAVVQIEECPIDKVILITDLETGKQTLRLFA